MVLELLNAAERHILARLSVFAGGFDLPAAEAVTAGDDPAADEAVAHLGAPVDKNLVQFDDAGTGRYRLLETVRQYAARQLEGSPAAAHGTRIAHRDYYLALAGSRRERRPGISRMPSSRWAIWTAPAGACSSPSTSPAR